MHNHKTQLLIILMIFSAAILGLKTPGFAQNHTYYQLKIYHFNSDNQENHLDQYLENAYQPALHRAGITHVGVFKSATGTDNNAASDSAIYVLIPFTSIEQFINLDKILAKDQSYASSGEDYLNAPYDKPPYQRYESILMEAFSGMPMLEVPELSSAPSERIYELRSYEAATEKLHQNKVAQFNEGEMSIFNRLGFNTVFYGRVLAGSQMPNLMYMTTFENMSARDAQWKTFSDDPEWKEFNAKPEYAHNYLRSDKYLLHPTSYSDI